MEKDIEKDIVDFYQSLSSQMKKIVLEDDLQEAMALYLVKKGYNILREVSVTNDDAPVTRELKKEHVEIDLVAYADERFYPIELKLYNKQEGGSPFTAEAYNFDRRKTRFYSKYFDVDASYVCALTDDQSLREDIAPEDEWMEINRISKREDYKWYGEYINGSGKKSFKDIWNRNVKKKLKGEHDKYSGETVVLLA